MHDPDDAIRRRALAFAETFKYINHRIVFSGDAAPEIVARFGAPQSTQYGEVRIAMDWPADHAAEILAQHLVDQIEALKTLIDAGHELRVTCSATDVIHHEWVGVT